MFVPSDGAVAVNRAAACFRRLRSVCEARFPLVAPCGNVSRTARLLLLLLLFGIVAGCHSESSELVESVTKKRPAASSVPSSELKVPTDNTDETADIVEAIQVRAGDDIQLALERAAQEGIRLVVVHSGTYRPPEVRQALIWLNARHDGIHLKAQGDVTLTAANLDLARRQDKSYPAVVSHVIYCGDGVGPETVIEGFKITGANNFTTTRRPGD